MANNIKTFDPLSNFNKAIKTLEKNNIRTTKQRMVLAKLLFEKGRRHISAEELFDEVKENLKIFLKAQTEFTDYDFEGGGMNILLDTLAYNTHYLGFNANMRSSSVWVENMFSR